jgi:putative colanic acid biosynthesis acetyltransferase WcaF
MAKIPLEIMPPIATADRIRRAVWVIAWTLLCRFTPIWLHRWRSMILRAFGASLHGRCYVYPSTRVWAPWNLEMMPGSCLGPDVNCYNVARIFLGERALVSQNSHLCSASHDFRVPQFPLVAAPIQIEADAWIAADVFVAPGITLHTGSVALARSVVTFDVPAWTVVAGNPARKLREREPFGANQ